MYLYGTQVVRCRDVPRRTDTRYAVVHPTRILPYGPCRLVLRQPTGTLLVIQCGNTVYLKTSPCSSVLNVLFILKTNACLEKRCLFSAKRTVPWNTQFLGDGGLESQISRILHLEKVPVLKEFLEGIYRDWLSPASLKIIQQ